MWLRPPGWVFFATCAVGALAWLWSASVPGIVLLLSTSAMLLLGACAFAWLARLIAILAITRGRHIERSWWRFALAPIGGVIVLGLVVLDVPLEVRWAQSRPAFAAVVADLGPPGRADQPESIDVADRIGTYRISSAFRQDEAVIFYEANGAFIDDAGFAYLPDGPAPALANGSFEHPQFRHLGGPWYSWTASW